MECECGAVVECECGALLECECGALVECECGARWNVSVEHLWNVSVEQCWTDTDWEIGSTLVNILQYLFVHHKRSSLSIISPVTGLLYTTNLFPTILIDITPRQ